MATDETVHYKMSSVPAHEAAFRRQTDDDQRRHLRLAHKIPDDDLPAQLGYLHRDEPASFTEDHPATAADVHEWWHIRQRRTFDRMFQDRDGGPVDAADRRAGMAPAAGDGLEPTS
jgi:hypothetical protein